jgi:hypothetical protein
MACRHCGLDPQSPEKNDAIIQWQKILQNNIRWGDTLACYKAKTENQNDIVCLKDLTNIDLQNLQFFNYKNGQLEEYIFPIDEEIKQQRSEYKIFNSQLSIFN